MKETEKKDAHEPSKISTITNPGLADAALLLTVRARVVDLTESKILKTYLLFSPCGCTVWIATLNQRCVNSPHQSQVASQLDR